MSTVLATAMVNLRDAIPKLAASMIATAVMVENMKECAGRVHDEAMRLRDGMRHLVPAARFDSLLATYHLWDGALSNIDRVPDVSEGERALTVGDSDDDIEEGDSF